MGLKDSRGVEVAEREASGIELEREAEGESVSRYLGGTGLLNLEASDRTGKGEEVV